VFAHTLNDRAVSCRIGKQQAIARQGLDIADNQPPRRHPADHELILSTPGQVDTFGDQVGQVGLR
jgi:hypothetical protein